MIKQRSKLNHFYIINVIEIYIQMFFSFFFVSRTLCLIQLIYEIAIERGDTFQVKSHRTFKRTRQWEIFFFFAKKSCKLSLILRGFLETFTARKFLKFLVNKNDFLVHDFKVVKIGFYVHVLHTYWEIYFIWLIWMIVVYLLWNED